MNEHDEMVTILKSITCPKCRGTVHGEIETTSDHFDALEALGDRDKTA